jgi:Icc-related predicted phosphoesterase
MKPLGVCRSALASLLLIVGSSLSLVGQLQPAELRAQINLPFRFVAYGDTRFTDPKNTNASNPSARQLLVKAIADAHPAFISIGGDIVYRGDDANDWKTWDTETAVWRDSKIPVYPALGNHDLSGDQNISLANYFQRFPDLRNSRYYSVRAANTLLLTLDSSLDETSGPQGQWLLHQLDTLPSDVEFVCLLLHHPPYTGSSDTMAGGGHSARQPEQNLAKILEERQPHTRARFVVIAGHVHNYEHYEHAAISYFVTGGGAAHPYPVPRQPGEPLYGTVVNYHYLLVEVDHGKMKVSMNRLGLESGKANWTIPESVAIATPSAAAKSGK